MDQVLLYFALKYNGDWKAIYDALEHKERIDEAELEIVEQQINCSYITIINPLYPEHLKSSYQPPFVLFYDGDINFLINFYKTIGLVQEEPISSYTFNQTEKILKALSQEKKTIVTLTPMDNLKFKLHQHILIVDQLVEMIRQPNQLLISESYQQNLTTDKERLLFSMANFLFVNELTIKSSLFHKLKIMIGNSEEIFVLPQENSSLKLANNWLIKQGAKLVESPVDILNDF